MTLGLMIQMRSDSYIKDLCNQLRMLVCFFCHTLSTIFADLLLFARQDSGCPTDLGQA